MNKKLNIVCISICELGHMIPILNLSEELVSRGHNLTIISDKKSNENIENKC